MVWLHCSKVPAFLNIVDIAGLVKGASEGQGLGNAFLSHIRACDAIFHVSRVFEDDEVTHVEGDVDPVRDLDIIFDELRLKDLEYLNKQIEGMERTVLRGADKAKKAVYVCPACVQLNAVFHFCVHTSMRCLCFLGYLGESANSARC